MSDSSPSLFRRLVGRFVPKTPDFHALLNDQAEGLVAAVELLVLYMETGSVEVGARLLEQEHKSDALKFRNLQALSEAFATPIDREDIYRAILGLDEVVNYGKATIKEMEALTVAPGKHDLNMAMRIRDGALALREGFAKLTQAPEAVPALCVAARKAERSVEKVYRQALVDLFEGTEYLNMFKRREIYRHLSNTADRIAACADTLNKIAVKLG